MHNTANVLAVTELYTLKLLKLYILSELYLIFFKVIAPGHRTCFLMINPFFTTQFSLVPNSVRQPEKEIQTDFSAQLKTSKVTIKGEIIKIPGL